MAIGKTPNRLGASKKGYGVVPKELNLPMIETDQIFIASSRLAESSGLRVAALDELSRIGRSPAYDAWYNGGTLQLQPFAIPKDICINILDDLLLVRKGFLCGKINFVHRSVMLTDGVWVDSKARVFPFSDESAAIFKYCNKRHLNVWADIVVDLATGSGHNLAFFSDDVPGIGLDVNPRALAYFHLNRLINGAERRVCILNDIRSGICNAVEVAENRKILIVGNLPFGLAPSRDALPLTSNGGERGVEMQRAAFSAIEQFRLTKRGICPIRAVLLAYSVGNAAEDQWEVVDIARSVFGGSDVRFSVLDDEGLLRVNGRRIMRNPSSLRSALLASGTCELYHADTAKAQALYSGLSDRLAARGFTDLAYLIVEIDGGHADKG